MYSGMTSVRVNIEPHHINYVLTILVSFLPCRKLLPLPTSPPLAAAVMLMQDSPPTLSPSLPRVLFPLVPASGLWLPWSMNLSHPLAAIFQLRALVALLLKTCCNFLPRSNYYRSNKCEKNKYWNHKYWNSND